MQHPSHAISSKVAKAIKSYCPELKDKGAVSSRQSLDILPGGLGSCAHVALIVDLATAKGILPRIKWTKKKRLVKRRKKRDDPPMSKLVGQLTTAGALDEFFNNKGEAENWRGEGHAKGNS